MALRHAFAHWSFSWATNGVDSEIVAVFDLIRRKFAFLAKRRTLFTS